MKRYFSFPNFCGLVAALVMAISIMAAVSCHDSPPTLAEKNPSVPACVEQLWTGVSSGDFAAAEAALSGNPQLELQPTEEGSMEDLLWQAHLSSLSYSLEGPLYTTDSGLAQDVAVTHLDIPAAAEAIGPLARQLLQELAEDTADTDSLYGPDGGYRQELTEEILFQAAQLTLENPPMTQTRLTLNMQYQAGAWYIQPEDALLRLLSGGLPE